MPKANDFLGILIFALLVTILFYLAVTLQVRQNEIIKKINLKGGFYLTNEQYLSYARLDNPEDFKNLSPALIRDRLEKHPYIKVAEVKLEKDGTADVIISEKKIEAFLNCGQKQYLVSKNFEALPLMSFTKKIDCPVISNPGKAGEIKNYENLLQNEDVKTAFKIVETTKLLSREMLKSVSEIDMRSGKDIVVYLSGINYPVVIGRRNEIRKMIYFSKFWSKLKGKEINQVVDYIDLRFDKHLYLGFTGGFDEGSGT